MTRNPFWIESTATGSRAHFMPEHEKSTPYVYGAGVKRRAEPARLAKWPDGASA